MSKKIDAWDIIIWICIVVLILYVVGKLTGLINTPEWVNLLPLITIIFLCGAFYQKIILAINRIDNNMRYLKKNIDKLAENQIGFEKRLYHQEKNYGPFTKLLSKKIK